MDSSNSIESNDTKNLTNLYKVWKAIFIITPILRTLVKTKLRKVHDRMVGVHGTCSKCLTANILPCPSSVCKKRGRKGICKTLHNEQNKQYRPCPGNTCENYRDSIIQNHRYQNPSWLNTEDERLAESYWQRAKCFLPPVGYKNINSIEDTDFNGIISILLNCTVFDNRFSFALTTGSCLFTKARNIINPLRHSPQGEITDQEVTELFRTFFDILKERIFAQLADAKTAENTLRKLEDGVITISREEKKEIVKQAAIPKSEPLQLPTRSAMDTLNLTNTTLIPTALVHYTNLTVLILSCCQCDGLDVSHCHNLERTEIFGPSTLSGNSMHGLKKLKCLKLYDVICERLDVSQCCILEEMDLRGALLSLCGSSVQNLHNLKHITLMCSCEEVDLTCCCSLERIMIKSPATFVCDTLCTLNLKNLRQLTLDCKCEELNLENCPKLELLYLGEKVKMWSTLISEFKMLKHLTLKCEVFNLDLTFFPVLETALIKDPVCINVKSLTESKTLKYLTLESFCFDKSDILTLKSDGAFQHNRIQLPPCIEHIKFIDVGCSSAWLRRLFTSLSNLNHYVQCTLYERYIMPSDEERVLEENYMSNVSLKCKKDSKGLYEALEGSKLQWLSLKTVEHKDWFAKIDPSCVKIGY